MDQEDNLSRQTLTEEELGRFTEAFKDENFRKMLRDYAEEISNPENRKKYEEEIAILEQDRGNSIQFIHPTPFKCVRTSVNGKLKCYVNVCSNDKIGKPSCKSGVSEDGMSGHHWSLPHSLHPERKEVDPKGNQIFIYDVVFHPDSLQMASTNERFMEMVMSVALKGIENAFNVCLDKNIRAMKTKYKGNPQPCVIRKPIPGFKVEDASGDPDPLAFPYPDEKAKVSKEDRPEILQIHSKVTKRGPTKPNHSVKYCSFIDLQDFRYSQDSSHKSRPRQIVITVDLPLLKSVTALTLEVKEKSLLLESQDPAYKLELSLAYAVDEDRGEAKFNKQTCQLMVTLPVRPSAESFQFNTCPVEGSADDIQEIVFERDSEAGQDQSNEGQANSEESDVKTTREISEQEDEACAASVKEHDADKSQYQEGHDQRLCEEMKMEELETVTADQSETERQKIQALEVKEVETEQKTIQGTELRTVANSAIKSKAQIRENSIQTGKEQPETLEYTEEPVKTMEMVTAAAAAAEMNKDPVKSENEAENTSTPSVLLREVSVDGSQTLISDHVTTACFSFNNSLMFELD